MARQLVNNMKLGIFVITGLLLLVVSLYVIGQKHSFFGSNFVLKARFKNVGGLMAGNNVRFSGIQCGTVEDIAIIEDTIIEVTMLINDKTSGYIRENALVDIGNEGLMGNKVVNIIPADQPAGQVKSGGMLHPRKAPELNDMLGTLSNTNDNAADISIALKQVAQKLNNSPVLWKLLGDTSIPVNLHQSLARLARASVNIEKASGNMDLLMADIRSGKGAAGVLLSDKKAAADISDAIGNINRVSKRANDLVENLDGLVAAVHNDLVSGDGILRAMLKDQGIVSKLDSSLNNIEKGTSAFYEDMEALKHSFVLRGYFRKQDKKAKSR